MRRLNRLRGGIAVVAGVGLVLGGAVAAEAGTSYADFNVVVPQFQAPYLGVGSQTKSGSNVAGDISITSVGSSYTVDATLCIAYGVNCSVGTKVLGLNDSTSAKLPNRIGSGVAGTQPVLQIGSWNVVSVQVIGRWRSN